MRRILPILALLCLAIPARAGYVSSTNSTSLPKSITGTSAGNSIVIIDNTVTTTAPTLKVGSDATTLLGEVVGNGGVATFNTFYYIDASQTGSGSVSVTCTANCGTVNGVAIFALNGLDSTTQFDHSSVCGTLNPATCTATYNPGFSAEDVLTFYVCSGSGTTTLGGNVTWLHTAAPNGNSFGFFESSAAGTITSTVAAACDSTGGPGYLGIMLGFKLSGATQGCTSDVNLYGPSTLTTATSQTVTGYVNQTGDLVGVATWCLSTCTGSATVGTDSTTQEVAGGSSSVTGQPFIYADLSSGVSGQQTITWSIGASEQLQVGYYDFTPSEGCHFVFDKNATGNDGGSGATAVNYPSITPSQAGEVIYGLNATQYHITAIGSPFSAFNNVPTDAVGWPSTFNANEYIVNAGSGTQTNNATSVGGTCSSSFCTQAILAAFKVVPNSSAVVRHRAWVIQ